MCLCLTKKNGMTFDRGCKEFPALGEFKGCFLLIFKNKGW